MDLIDRVKGPQDLRGLSAQELAALGQQIREFLVDRVSRTGGHLGPNLGVVELTLALHRVFDSPTDALLWDTGHQAYVHKIVTGRAAAFDRLRQRSGLSGYPSRSESPHDWIESSHASAALSYADGLAKAWDSRGRPQDRRVVVVVGDGALTGGMAWEALNNIAAGDRQVVIVVNDNERSYSPTIGGLANHLATLRTTRGYEGFLRAARRLITNTPVVGQPVFDTLHGVKRGVKDVLAPQGMFEDLGLKYLGPVDGHDLEALEHVLQRAYDYRGPVIVHAITQKGRGYAPAEQDEADRFHGVGVIDPGTGRALRAGPRTWTACFADELIALAEVDSRVVGITAAMAGPTGIARFAEQFPDRAYDVGIAEQHAVTSAVGMAMGGLRPVVAVYATFLNRAFDQVLMDAALHRAPITIVLDRAGITGDDGASHNGMWDLSMLQVVPDLRIAAPRDEPTLRRALVEAVAQESGPTVVRFPKGALPPPQPVLRSRGGVDVLVDIEPGRTAGPHDGAAAPLMDVVLVAAGATAQIAVEAAQMLQAEGFTAQVLSSLWVCPVAPELVDMCRGAALVVSVEDNCRVAGAGSRLALALADAGIDVPVRTIGAPWRFLDQGSRAEVLQECGLDPQGVLAEVRKQLAELRIGAAAAPVAAVGG